MTTLDSNVNSKPLPDAPHPFNVMKSSNSVVSEFTEVDSLIFPPPTIWTKFVKKYRFGKAILISAGAFGIFLIMFIVLGTLDVFESTKYRSKTGLISIGQTRYEGTSSGSFEDGTKEGSGDGTYYDPGVGLTACGTLFTALDYVVAMNIYDFGNYANPNNSPTCGQCIIITGPNGSQKAQIQDICPAVGCQRGSVDMSPAVFNKVGDLASGRIPISWKQC